MDSENAEQDRRHLGQMRTALASTPANPAALGALLAELEGLAAALMGSDDVWQRSVTGHWGALEEVYAVALDRKMDAFDDELTTIAAAAITELRGLVDEALTRLPTVSES